MVSLSWELWGNSLEEYIIFLCILALGIASGKIISWIVEHLIKQLTRKTKTKIDDVLVDVCHGPLVFAVFIITLSFAEQFLDFSASTLTVYDGLLRILITINLAWIIIRFLDSAITNYVVPYTEKSSSDLDEMILPILHTVVKILVVCVACIMILSDFGFNVAGLVAGLGIGGLAVAFAAKDLISNIFGGISVIADTPFKIGDMIKFDSRQGTIKEIGIRTTRMETLDGTTLIIPNAKFTDGIIENVTKRKQHRVTLVLGLQYDTTSKKLAQAKKILAEIIKKHKGTKDDTTVFFSAFGASSVDLTLHYYVTDLKSIAVVQDEINTKIKESFEKTKIEFAYPTQTVILKK